MVQRQSLFGRRSARRNALTTMSPGPGPEHTIPAIPPVRLFAAEESTILGFPVDEDTAGGPVPVPETPAAADTANHQVRVVALPRADPVAGITLALAGIAAAASLLFPWRVDEQETGSTLVRAGLAAVGSGFGDTGRSGMWEAPAIVIGGALLLLLGVLLFLPARTHRVAGVLALFLAAGVCTAVLFRVARTGWVPERFATGMWLAIAVAGLGLLGALKAMLTVPRVTVKRRRDAHR